MNKTWKLVEILSLENLFYVLHLRLGEKHTIFFSEARRKKKLLVKPKCSYLFFDYYRSNSSSEYILSNDAYLLSNTLQKGKHRIVTRGDVLFWYLPGSNQETNEKFFGLIATNCNPDLPVGSESHLTHPQNWGHVHRQKIKLKWIFKK